MEIRYLLADLLCVFIPLFALDAWHETRPAWSLRNGRLARAVLSGTFALSAFLTTLFNFQIADGVKVNLSIVPLTLTFFVLPLGDALLTLLAYVASQVVLSAWLLGHSLFSAHAWASVLRLLPGSMVIVALYALLMSACARWTRSLRFRWRITAFVATLWLYTAADFVYVEQERHLHPFDLGRFAWYVILFSFVFALGVHFVTAGHNRRLRRLSEARNEKLQLISQMAASVAHELRNPITVVRGFAQLMLTHDYPRARTAEFLRNMMDELDKAEAVISTYIQLSSAQAEGEATEFDLSRAAKAAAEIMVPYADSCAVTLSAEVEEGVFISADPAHVSQAVIHLIRNAIESHDGPGHVQVSLRRTGRRAILTVADSGRGIPADRLQHLGQPHYATHTTGTGLGLTVTYKIVHESGGTIEVASREGEGTTFTVTFPVSAELKGIAVM